MRNNAFSLNDYLDVRFRSQDAQVAASADKADIVLVMGKPSKENEAILIDNNFFMKQLDKS